MRSTIIRRIHSSIPRLSTSSLSSFSSTTTSSSSSSSSSTSNITASIPPIQTPSSSSSSSPPPTHHLITLLRSPRGLPPKSSKTLEALGLYKLHKSVLQPIGPATMGKILAVKELVSVRNVSERDGEEIMERQRVGRKEGSGLEVSGRFGR